jgi:hypothetical protein
MKRLLLVAALVLVACNKKSAPPPKEDPTPKTDPTPPAPTPPDTGHLEPIKQAADFPKDRWVRTVLFDGKTPYIGFTYVDPSKGNCIKGEEITGLTDDQIKERLHAKFPSSSMEPIPEGHPMTLLTPEEIKKYDLPDKPEWVSYFEH